MKKRKVFLTMAAICVGLSACGSGESSKETKVSTTTVNGTVIDDSDLEYDESGIYARNKKLESFIYDYYKNDTTCVIQYSEVKQEYRHISPEQEPEILYLYLVTTNMKQKKGPPNPLCIEKKCGNVSMVNFVRQILYLTQLHVGSTNKMKLPITTGYADKICKIENLFLKEKWIINYFSCNTYNLDI